MIALISGLSMILRDCYQIIIWVREVYSGYFSWRGSFLQYLIN